MVRLFVGRFTQIQSIAPVSKNIQPRDVLRQSAIEQACTYRNPGFSYPADAETRLPCTHCNVKRTSSWPATGPAVPYLSSSPARAASDVPRQCNGRNLPPGAFRRAPTPTRALPRALPRLLTGCRSSRHVVWHPTTSLITGAASPSQDCEREHGRLPTDSLLERSPSHVASARHQVAGGATHAL